MERKKGSKLNRTEIFNVRFDPKLKWAADLLAAKERRTLSSLVEWVMEKVVKEIAVTSDDGKPVTAWQVADKAWEEEPLARIMKLSLAYPDLLTNTEGRISSALSLLAWFEESCMPNGNIVFLQPVAKKILPSILACAEGEIDQAELFKLYRQTRMELLAQTDKSGSQELRDMVTGGAFDNHPEAKNLVAKLVGTQ